jgi:RimJ/RimL family protein N-acetyltransferase
LEPPDPVTVARLPLDAIAHLRERYRHEMRCQIVHDALHAHGLTDLYALHRGDGIVAYGAVWSDGDGPRDIVKEFYVRPADRAAALPLFRRLIAASGARWVEAQTNDVLLTLLLFDTTVDLTSDWILFADAGVTHLTAPGVVVRPVTEADRARMFPHTLEPVGDWGLVRGEEVVGTGGLMFHYNPPYGDIYMEVAAPHRRRGYGSYLVQELKRLCYERGRVPAARCRVDNLASRRALERAGMLPCARIVRGRVAP